MAGSAGELRLMRGTGRPPACRIERKPALQAASGARQDGIDPVQIDCKMQNDPEKIFVSHTEWSLTDDVARDGTDHCVRPQVPDFAVERL